jgi:hypothetical protein
MAEASTRQKRTNPIALAMKTIGYLTDPKTAPGKVFGIYEKNLTAAFELLAHNELYLIWAGRMMEQSFRARRDAIAAMEGTLRLFRIPTASDVGDLRREVRAVSDQIEALGAQLEVVVEALEQRKGEGQ